MFFCVTASSKLTSTFSVKIICDILCLWSYTWFTATYYIKLELQNVNICLHKFGHYFDLSVCLFVFSTTNLLLILFLYQIKKTRLFYFPQNIPLFFHYFIYSFISRSDVLSRYVTWSSRMSHSRSNEFLSGHIRGYIHRAFRNWKPHVNMTFHYKVMLKLFAWQSNTIQKELHTIGHMWPALAKQGTSGKADVSHFLYSIAWPYRPYPMHLRSQNINNKHIVNNKAHRVFMLCIHEWLLL